MARHTSDKLRKAIEELNSYQQPHEILSKKLAYPTAWVGCGECDSSFECHEGKQGCIRRTPIGNVWLRVLDEALVSSFIGMANRNDSYEVAKKKLNDLILWNIQVATDPAVNGGFRLLPVDPTKEMQEAGYFGNLEANRKVYQEMIGAYKPINPLKGNSNDTK